MKKPIILILTLLVILSGIGFLVYKNSQPNSPSTPSADLTSSPTPLSFKEAVGKRAPNFILKDIEGNNIDLKNFRGENIILFFNEGLMCYPACLNQVAELGKDSRFNNEQVNAFSIVVDSQKNWQKAQKELSYLAGAKVLFDENKEVSRLYDVLKLPSVMHYGSYPGHTYFIIDKEGVIRYTLDDPNMAIRNDQLFVELQKLQ